MQNKPNFQKSQMNVNAFSTMDYENISDWTLGQNKPNSNPIKPNLRKAKMNVNLYFIEDYRKKDDFVVRINKPNFQNGQNDRKRICYRGLRQCYRLPAQKNKPKTNPISKGQNRLPVNLATPFPGLWKKIIDMLLFFWNNKSLNESSN